MDGDIKINGLSGADIMTQTEFLQTAVEMLCLLKDDELSEARRNEIRRGVRFFLSHCIDENLESVDANAVRHYLQHLLSEPVTKTTYLHLFSVLQHFFHWVSEVEGIFPDITAGIVPEYKIRKARRIRRGRGAP